METAPLEDIKGVITVRVSCNLMLPPNIKAKTEKLLCSGYQHLAITAPVYH